MVVEAVVAELWNDSLLLEHCELQLSFDEPQHLVVWCFDQLVCLSVVLEQQLLEFLDERLWWKNNICVDFWWRNSFSPLFLYTEFLLICSMYFPNRFIFATLLLICSLVSSVSALEITPISSENGVVLSSVRDEKYAKNSKVYLLETNLLSGATIDSSATMVDVSDMQSPGFMLRPLVSSVTSKAPIAASLCDPKDKIVDAWVQVASHLDLMSTSRAPFALLNGQFFGNYYALQPGYTSRLAFGVFEDGDTLSLWYGRIESYRKKILTISSKGARIQWYKLSNAYALKWEIGSLAIVGLHPLANKDSRSESNLGRVYAGVGGAKIRGGWSSRVYFLVATGIEEREAFAILRKAWARETMMLDGGWSTQLWAAGQSRIASSRPIPHAIAIFPNQKQ